MAEEITVLLDDIQQDVAELRKRLKMQEDGEVIRAKHQLKVGDWVWVRSFRDNSLRAYELSEIGNYQCTGYFIRNELVHEPDDQVMHVQLTLTELLVTFKTALVCAVFDKNKDYSLEL